MNHLKSENGLTSKLFFEEIIAVFVFCFFFDKSCILEEDGGIGMFLMLLALFITYNMDHFEYTKILGRNGYFDKMTPKHQ